MRIKISLSYKHDADLLLLAYNPYFNLKQAILDSLESYASGIMTTIPVPLSTEQINFDVSGGYPKKIITMDIYEKKNPGAYQLLNSIPSAFRTMCVKSILRHCLNTPYIQFFIGYDNSLHEFSPPIKTGKKTTRQMQEKNPFDAEYEKTFIKQEAVQNTESDSAGNDTAHQNDAVQYGMDESGAGLEHNIINDPESTDEFDIFAEGNSFVENY